MWLGPSPERLSEALSDILGGGGREASERHGVDDKWWPMARDILNIFIETDGVRSCLSEAQGSMSPRQT